MKKQYCEGLEGVELGINLIVLTLLDWVIINHYYSENPKWWDLSSGRRHRIGWTTLKSWYWFYSFISSHFHYPKHKPKFSNTSIFKLSSKNPFLALVSTTNNYQYQKLIPISWYIGIQICTSGHTKILGKSIEFELPTCRMMRGINI